MCQGFHISLHVSLGRLSKNLERICALMWPQEQQTVSWAKNSRIFLGQPDSSVVHCCVTARCSRLFPCLLLGARQDSITVSLIRTKKGCREAQGMNHFLHRETLNCWQFYYNLLYCSRVKLFVFPLYTKTWQWWPAAETIYLIVV